MTEASADQRRRREAYLRSDCWRTRTHATVADKDTCDCGLVRCAPFSEADFAAMSRDDLSEMHTIVLRA